jgi:hypothetical protein
VAVGLDGDLELGADTIIGRHQHRVGETRGLQVEQAAEAADLAIGAGPARRAHQRLDPVDERVAGVDVNAGRCIGEPRLVFAHAAAPWRGLLKSGSSHEGPPAARPTAFLLTANATAAYLRPLSPSAAGG